MADPRHAFYRSVLEQLLAAGVVRRDHELHVAAGGRADRDVLHELGFADVTISNLDEREQAAGLEPYAWRHEDLEALSLADASVDVAIVAAGLHHCRSPHRALLELYRVARVAVVAIESRDSALMRLAAHLRLADDYELAAVAAHGLRAGGVANSAIPNYVYRWTEREVAKTVASFAPHVRHRFHWFRAFELPDLLVDGVRGPRRLALRALRPAAAMLTRVLPRQANLFAFAIEKPQVPRDLQPWLRLDAGAVAPDERAFAARYRIER